MSKPLIDIMSLNQTRYGTTFDFNKAMSKLQEELEEFSEGFTKADTHEMVDALADIIVIAAGELVKLGFNPELCLKQTVKEISSRNQCPEQASRWAANNKQPGEKWLKDPNQPQSTLYIADYSTCKLPGNL